MVLLLLLALFWLFFTVGAEAKGHLYGKVVVIDAGHGGQDPGSHGRFGSDKIWEDEYAYDVALRVRDLVRKQEGLAFLTTQDPNHKTPRDWSSSRVFPADHDEVFSLDRSQVRARTVGMQRRLAYANTIKRRYPRHQVVFIAIHFDVVGKRNDIEGVQVIADRPSSVLARALVDAFGERMRRENPFEVIGQGARNLYILNGENRIRDRVLIELGNFNNPNDVWRIRNFKVRQDYAERIVKALRRR